MSVLHVDDGVGTVSKRPNFGKAQVKRMKDVMKGHYYILHTTTFPGVEVLATSEVYKRYGNWVVELLPVGENGYGNGSLETLHLRDLGILPYDNHRWHSSQAAYQNGRFFNQKAEVVLSLS